MDDSLSALNVGNDKNNFISHQQTDNIFSVEEQAEESRQTWQEHRVDSDEEPIPEIWQRVVLGLDLTDLMEDDNLFPFPENNIHMNNDDINSDAVNIPTSTIQLDWRFSPSLDNFDIENRFANNRFANAVSRVNQNHETMNRADFVLPEIPGVFPEDVEYVGRLMERESATARTARTIRPFVNLQE